MKKQLLTIIAIGFLTLGLNSCKSKTEPAVETTEVVAPVETPTSPATATEVVSSIEVPTFENADAQKFVSDYKTLMEEYAALKGTGDQEKAKALSAKFMTWANGAAQLQGKIKADEMQKFNDFMQTAENKFNEMNSAIAK